jgi:hypothetical protein
MRFLLRTLIVVGLLGGIAIVLTMIGKERMPGNNAQVELAAKPTLTPLLDKMKNAVGTTGSNSESGGISKVYRWRDEYENWHYGDQPPNREYQTVYIGSGTKAVASMADPQRAVDVTPHDEPGIGASSLFAPLENVRRIPALIEEAKLASELLEQRREIEHQLLDEVADGGVPATR